jgi:hypothetical protein
LTILKDRAVNIEQNPADGWGTAMPVKAAKEILRKNGGTTIVCLGIFRLSAKKALRD